MFFLKYRKETRTWNIFKQNRETKKKNNNKEGIASF